MSGVIGAPKSCVGARLHLDRLRVRGDDIREGASLRLLELRQPERRRYGGGDPAGDDGVAEGDDSPGERSHGEVISLAGDGS